MFNLTFFFIINRIVWWLSHSIINCSREFNLMALNCYDPLRQDRIYEINSLHQIQRCSKGSKNSKSSNTSSTLNECSKNSKCSKSSNTTNTSNNQKYENIWRVYIKTRCFLWILCSIQIIKSQLFLQIYFKQIIKYNYLFFTFRDTVFKNPFRHSNW